MKCIIFVSVKQSYIRMKHKGSKCEFEKERNNDLMAAYHQLMEATEYINHQTIFKEVVNMPAPRFYVSEERAKIVLYWLMRGDSLDKMLPNRREMFQEIYRRVMELRKKQPELTVFELAIKVVHQPAPKFYLTPDSAKIIILKAKRQWYETRKKRLRHLF